MYKDEEIAERRYWEQRKKYKDVDSGIYSGTEYLNFAETVVFDKIGVVIPARFQEMSSEEAKKKYPSEQRPLSIKSNEDGSVNFAFNLITQKTEESELETLVSDFMRVMKRLYPMNICLGTEKKQGDSLPYASAEFTSMAINGSLYNMVAVYPIEDKLFIMSFNCPFEDRTDWETCLSQIKERVTFYEEGVAGESN